MKKANIHCTMFTNLTVSEFSSLSEFENKSVKDVHLFLSGKLYNCTLDALFDNYLTSGFKVFDNVDGDFLLFIIEKNAIHVVRDRHGVGSQFFYSDQFFSTSLIDFVQLPEFKCEPNYEALMTFLSIGYIPSPMTSLQGVSKLKGGHVLSLSNGVFTVVDLFSYESYMKKVATSGLSEKEAIEQYELLHKQSIKNRIVNSKKVGLLLSGGYDSGGNISALRDLYNGDVVTYCIGFKDNPWTELPLAKILSERYNSKHFEYEIDGSEIMQLPQIIAQTGDPFQEGGLFVNFTAMQLVKQSGEQPDIILGGDGNDQHFGTSGKELAMHWKLKSKGLTNLQKIYDKVGDSISYFEKDNVLFRTEFHNRKILHIQQSDTFGFTLSQLNKINNKGIKIKQLKYLNDAPTNYSSFDDFFYNRNYNIDIKQVIDEVILYKSSRMSELFENRISFPYMSTELYHFLNEMPVNYKFKGSIDDLSKGKGISKYLHKSYLKPKLPTEITDRKKQGGFAPLPIFLRDKEQRHKLFNYLKNSDAVKKLFKKESIDNLLAEYEMVATSKPYWFWCQQVKANQVINLLTLAVWWEMFLNKKSDLKNISELF